MTQSQNIVCLSGLLLFVLGLLNGLIIPKTKSPRLSLSAHLTAVQCGTFLIAIAWAWPHFMVSAQASVLVAQALSGSMLVLWFAFFLAGLWGAGRNLPIAGQNSETGRMRQIIVTASLGLGVVGTIATSLFLLYTMTFRF
jgi:(hydroxyamino)benzene mutase